MNRAIFKLNQTSKMMFFAKIVNGFKLLTIFAIMPILDAWLGSEYVSFAYSYVSDTARKLKWFRSKSKNVSAQSEPSQRAFYSLYLFVLRNNI